MDKSNKILVTGGTGFIGSYILRMLVAEGYQNIFAIRRKESKLDLVMPIVDQVQWIELDLLDSPGIYELMQDIDAVIHAAAMVSFDKRDTQKLLKVNVEGTANLVNACLENAVKKFIHVSSIAVFSRKPGPQSIDEKTEWDYQFPNTNYALSKYKSEMEVWRAGSEGLPMAIINPSLVLGSGFWQQGSASIFKKIYDQIRFYPTGVNGFVDVRDVAKATITLLQNPMMNERFIISSENRSYKDIMFMIANHLDRRPPHIALNPFLREVALLRSWTMRNIFNHSEVVSRGTLRNAQGTFYFDSSKSQKKLGLTYLSIEDSIRQTCIQLKEAAEEGFKPMYLPL